MHQLERVRHHTYHEWHLLSKFLLSKWSKSSWTYIYDSLWAECMIGKYAYGMNVSWLWTISVRPCSALCLKKRNSVHKILMSVPARLTEVTRYKSENVWSRWKSMCQKLYFTRLWHMLNVQIRDKEAREMGREMNKYTWDGVYIKAHGFQCQHTHTRLCDVLIKRNAFKPLNYLCLVLFGVLSPASQGFLETDWSTYTLVSSAASHWRDS